MSDLTDPTGTVLERPPQQQPAAPAPELLAEEPAETVVQGEEPTALLGTAPLTLPEGEAAIPVITRTVSGRYLGTLGSFRLELRVDVDRTRPMRKASGDFYSVSGSTVTYFGSFIVDSPTVTVTTTEVRLRGLGRFTFAAGAPVVQVTIPRRSIFQPAAPATVQFFTTSNAPGATYLCAFQSAFFRSVRMETDRVSDVATPVFSSYNTGSLPSGGPARVLSVAGAYAEAGVEMAVTAASNVINISEAGANATWSDAELHAAMQRHFSLYQDMPQWAVWLLVCRQHDRGPGLLGIMFDQAGLQRQGCAVFHQGIGGTTPDRLRLQLYTYVHELGHCFNLLHSWQKSLARPPGVDRPRAMSWMNYPWGYPDGDAAFWNAFPFQFDDPELVHLRHAFRNDIIMGGNPFGTGSGLVDPALVADPVEDNSGLQFEIEPAHRSFAYGEPVVVRLSLRASDRRGRMAHAELHPRTSITTVVIGKPNGDTVVYEPYIDHLMASQPVPLRPGQTIEESAYIGFGADGFYFERPGTYRVRAIYHAPDGSRVMSNTVELRVRFPTSEADEEVGSLMIGEEQGALLYLLGSDSEFLREGNEALNSVLEHHPKHPLADYVRLVHGVNLRRTFKLLEDPVTLKVRVRSPDLGAAQAMMNEAASTKSRVDVNTKADCLEQMASALQQHDDLRGADAALNQARALRSARRS